MYALLPSRRAVVRSGRRLSSSVDPVADAMPRSACSAALRSAAALLFCCSAAAALLLLIRHHQLVGPP